MNKFFFLLLAIVSFAAYGQNSLPNISKEYYNASYRKNDFNRTKSTERTARKLQAPIVLNGYLTVYNEDLGYYNQHPDAMIEQLNAQKKFGRDNWRIPTPDELSMMESNATKLGMGSDIYMCTSHANGNLRLVSTDGDYANLVKIGNTYWTKSNYGTNIESEKGRPMSYSDAVNNAPKGYRLPTYDEALNLISSGEVRFGDLTSGNSLVFPFTRGGWSRSGVVYISEGEYWIQGGAIIYFERYAATRGLGNPESSVEMPQISSRGHSSECYVRYVLDK